MDLQTFLNLPTQELAAHVRERGLKVCVFPINGTRRWYYLEHTPRPDEDLLDSYLSAVEQNHIALYKLIFDHGVDYLLTPVFGPDLMERGNEYTGMVAAGLTRLTSAEYFLKFFDEYEVRVRFYGDYRKYFANTPYTFLIELFEELAERTKSYNRHRLFMGLFAHDATESVAHLAVEYHRKHGRVPNRDTLIELYYGEYVPPVDVFIGFNEFCAFDMPLVADGNEDLYFTVNPSPYLNAPQLREIFYDRLHTRRSEADYSSLEAEEWERMRAFYQANLGKTQGIGARHPSGGYWYPRPQVIIPPGFDEMDS